MQTSDTRKCLDLSPGAGTGSRTPCQRCAHVEDLLQQVAELQEGMRMLCNIRETEKEWANSKHSGPTAYGQAARNSPTGTCRREESQ